ncbi:MAG: helix-turn-helix transcriptional regulator [Bacteriovorax sp.]|nr:helix-turn-helix transcriptional regulator [Bacteriovorax sp.]
MKNPILGKHSHNNRESREGQALRFIREALKLSQKDVALKLNIKSLEVDHFENGRKFYSVEDIGKFLVCYDVDRDFFNNLLNQKKISKLMVNHLMVNKTIL